MKCGNFNAKYKLDFVQLRFFKIFLIFRIRFVNKNMKFISDHDKNSFTEKF